MKTKDEIIEILLDHLTMADCDTCEYYGASCKKCEGSLWELSENEAARIAGEILED